MARVLVNDESLTAIADAIREKLDVETAYLPSQMAGAIENIPTGSSLTSADEGKVVVESSGNYVLQAQTSRSILQNGTYDTTTNDEVVVNVSGGGPANTGLPYSDSSHVKCIADFDNFDSSSTTWGDGSSPVLLQSTTTEYNNEEAVYIDALTNQNEARVELGSTTSDFTMYAVIKGIQYASGDVIVLGSVNQWSNKNAVMLYHRSGTTWISSVYGSADKQFIDTGGDYVAVAIKSSAMSASWLAHTFDTRLTVSYTTHGTDFTFGYRSGVYSTDLAVKFIGYVDEAESDRAIMQNLLDLADRYQLT